MLPTFPRLLLALFCGLASVACAPPPGEVATPDAESLLVQAFPGWRPGGKGQVRDVALHDGSAPGKIADLRPVPAMVTPLEVVRLDDRHAAVLTQATRLNDYNEPESCHACAGWLGAYIFRLDGERWQMRQRLDSILPIGVYGDIGKLTVARHAGLGQVAAIEWGSCWGGYCGSWLTLVTLGPEQASIIARNLPLYGENTGAHPDCEALADHTTRPAPDDAAHACFAITGRWQIENARLHIDFSGWERPLAADGQALPRRELKERVSYVLRHGVFETEAGHNPVPPL